MAHPKASKKELAKEKEKAIEKPIKKLKKTKKRNYSNFSIYIYKVLKQFADIGISRKSMLIMNNFVLDMLEKISKEAGTLASLSKKKTIGSREIQSAMKLLIPGELAKHANIDGVKALASYRKNNENDKQ